MNELDGKVKHHDIDYDIIINYFEQNTQEHEEKAVISRFSISRWWHRRKARKERENAEFIRHLQKKYGL